MQSVLLRLGPARRAVVVGGAFLAVVHTVIVGINLSPLIERPAWRHLFGLKDEATFNTWLSSALLLGIAISAIVIWYAEAEPQSRNRSWSGWWTISIGFVVLSIDETAATHELAGNFADRYLDISWAPGGNNWIFVVTPFAAAFAGWTLYWLWSHLGGRHPTAVLGSIAIVLWVLVPLWHAPAFALGLPIWLAIVEETSEFVGELLFLAGLLWYLVELGPFGVVQRPT